MGGWSALGRLAFIFGVDILYVVHYIALTHKIADVGGNAEEQRSALREVPNMTQKLPTLDGVVFEVLGLTEAEQVEVYRAVVELVKHRLVKARSV